MKNGVDQKLINSFNSSILNDGDVWRMLRQATILDLINAAIINYCNDFNINRLYDIFNYCMKALIKREVKLSGILNDDYKLFYTDNTLLKDEYLKIFIHFKSDLSLSQSTRFSNLNDISNYIKVMNDLDLDNFSLELFEDIRLSIYLQITKLSPSI
jgi:hypothetical protein